MTVPIVPGSPQLSKTSGTRCAGRWRSIYVGVPNWQLPENRGKYARRFKKGILRLSETVDCGKTWRMWVAIRAWKGRDT